MENSTLRDQLHETLGQFAALQKSHDETAGKFKETAAQLDLVKQKARVKLASLTKEVEDLKKKNAELSSKDETSSSPVDDLEKEKSRASDAERRAEEAEEKVRQIEEKAREAEERALQVEEQLREAEGKARQAEEQTSVLEQRLLDQQRATSEETESLRSRIQVLETELSEARQMQASQLVDSEGAQASAARIVELEGQVTLNAEDLEKERNRADDAENKILEAEAKAREAAEEAREMEQRLLASSSALEQRLLDQQQASVEEAESLRSRIEALEAELSEARLQSTRSVDSDSEGAQAVAAKIAELEARAASLAEDLEKERNLVVDAENKAREAEDRLLDLQRASTVEAELLRSRIEALEAESSEVRQMQSTQSMELDSEGAQAAAARIAELETRSASLAEDLKKERSLVIDAESKAREVEERLVVQQRDSSEEIEALRSRIGTLENELSEARQTHSVQSMDLSSEGAQAMNVRITELESQAALLVEELARERNRAADAENKALEIEERLVSSAATSEEKRLQTSEELESLRLRVEALEAELSEARNAQMRSADVSTTDELTTKIAELEERNSSLLRDLEQAAVDADSSKDDNAVRDLESRANRAEELENALREATTRIEELEEALRGVKANQKDMELSNAQEGQNAQLETPQKEREELEGRLSAGEKVIRELEQRLEQAQRHAEDLAQRVQDIDSQKRNELEVSRGELEAALARAGELQAELEERDRIAAERRHMADTLEDDLAEAQKTVAEKEAGLERTGIRIQELERELELARAAGVPAEPPPSYEGPDPRELEKEVSDLKRLVEELRQQPPPPTAAEDVIESSPAVDAADLERLRMDMEEALKAKEADWEEERNALEEAAREAVRRVENLERELEETKRAVSEAEAAAAAAAAAPVPIPVELTARLKELEDRNFTLEEQARDFSLQIKTRTDTIAKQQEQHAALKAEVDRAKGEWEEKFKKMRNILAQANKNIAETREKLGVAEKEKERLAALVQTKEEAEVQSEAERSSLRGELLFGSLTTVPHLQLFS